MLYTKLETELELTKEYRSDLGMKFKPNFVHAFFLKQKCLCIFVRVHVK